MIHPDQLELDEVEINNESKPSFSVHMQVGAFVANWHDHDKHQLLYAEGGVMHLYTRSHCYLLPARHAAWIPAFCEHSVTSTSPELYLRMIYFNPASDLDLIEDVRIFPINNLAREMIYHTHVWNYSRTENNELEAAFLKMIQMFISEWSAISVPLSLPATIHPKLVPVLDFMRKQLQDNLTQVDTAKRFAMSNRTLMRLFQQELGINFTTFIRITRIIRALDLLSKPGATVSGVALDVGYESLSAFSSTFRQLVGLRPQEYLKKSLLSHA